MKPRVAINEGVSPRRKKKRGAADSFVLSVDYCNVLVCRFFWDRAGWDKYYTDFKRKGGLPGGSVIRYVYGKVKTLFSLF